MLTARPRFSKWSLGTVRRPWWDADPDQLSLSVNKPDQTHNNHYSHDTLISPPANEHLCDCGLSYVRQPCGTAECQELRRCFFLEILIPVCVLQSSWVLFPKKTTSFLCLCNSNTAESTVRSHDTSFCLPFTSTTHQLKRASCFGKGQSSLLFNSDCNEFIHRAPIAVCRRWRWSSVWALIVSNAFYCLFIQKDPISSSPWHQPVLLKSGTSHSSYTFIMCTLLIVLHGAMDDFGQSYTTLVITWCSGVQVTTFDNLNFYDACCLRSLLWGIVRPV